MTERAGGRRAAGLGGGSHAAKRSAPGGLGTPVAPGACGLLARGVQLHRRSVPAAALQRRCAWVEYGGGERRSLGRSAARGRARLAPGAHLRGACRAACFESSSSSVDSSVLALRSSELLIDPTRRRCPPLITIDSKGGVLQPIASARRRPARQTPSGLRAACISAPLPAEGTGSPLQRCPGLAHGPCGRRSPPRTCQTSQVRQP